MCKTYIRKDKAEYNMKLKCMGWTRTATRELTNKTTSVTTCDLDEWNKIPVD